MAAKRTATKKRTSKAASKATTKVVTEAATAAPPMNSLDRDALALRVLDLALAGIEKQLIDDPASLTASGLGAVSRILTFYQKARVDLDDGSAQRAEHEQMLGELGDLSTFAAQDAEAGHDPMLQQS